MSFPPEVPIILETCVSETHALTTIFPYLLLWVLPLIFQGSKGDFLSSLMGVAEDNQEIS